MKIEYSTIILLLTVTITHVGVSSCKNERGRDEKIFTVDTVRKGAIDIHVENDNCNDQDSLTIDSIKKLMNKNGYTFLAREGKTVDSGTIENYRMAWYCYSYNDDSSVFKLFLKENFKKVYYGGFWNGKKQVGWLHIIRMSSSFSAIKMYSIYILNALDLCSDRRSFITSMILKRPYIFLYGIVDDVGLNNKDDRKIYSLLYNYCDTLIMDSIGRKRYAVDAHPR